MSDYCTFTQHKSLSLLYQSLEGPQTDLAFGTRSRHQNCPRPTCFTLSFYGSGVCSEIIELLKTGMGKKAAPPNASLKVSCHRFGGMMEAGMKSLRTTD
jgi:hypothetical protein